MNAVNRSTAAARYVSVVGPSASCGPGMSFSAEERENSDTRGLASPDVHDGELKPAGPLSLPGHQPLPIPFTANEAMDLAERLAQLPNPVEVPRDVTLAHIEAAMCLLAEGLHHVIAATGGVAWATASWGGRTLSAYWLYGYHGDLEEISVRMRMTNKLRSQFSW